MKVSDLTYLLILLKVNALDSKLMRLILICTLAIWQKLRASVGKRSLASLDTVVLDPYIHGLEIESNGQKTEISVDISSFTTWNNTALKSLDECFMNAFSAKLTNKEGGSCLVSHAALAGGYLHVICSTGHIREQVLTASNFIPVSSECVEDIGLHLRNLLLCRFAELVDQIMLAIRPDEPGREGHHDPSVAYASAAILHNDVEHFKNSLKYGALCERVS